MFWQNISKVKNLTKISPNKTYQDLLDLLFFHLFQWHYFSI